MLLMMLSCSRDGAVPTGEIYRYHGQSCGILAVGQNWNVPTEAIECFLTAWGSRRAAHLVITGPTVEGDAITHGYQVTGETTFDFIDDARQDHYGRAEARLYHCERPRETAVVRGDELHDRIGCAPEGGELLAAR